MKKIPALTSGVSEPETVDTYLKALDHPLEDVAVLLRKIILSVDKSVGEGIAWNAPVFFYTGKLPPFDPKEYRRYLVGFNFFKKDQLRIIFLRGASVEDKTGLLEGDYKDGRRLATFGSVAEVKQKEKALKEVIKQLLKDAKG